MGRRAGTVLHITPGAPAGAHGRSPGGSPATPTPAGGAVFTVLEEETTVPIGEPTHFDRSRSPRRAGRPTPCWSR